MMRALLILCLLAPGAVAATETSTDLTDLFIDRGIVEIYDFRVYEFEGVVLLRGRTGDPALAEEVMGLATSLGYFRVANLIQIVPALAEGALEHSIRRELRARPLDGCTFQVEARKGVVYLLGEVNRADQKELAVRLVRRIDGVRAVRVGLTLRDIPRP